MRCTRCGAENAPGSNVCSTCGTPLVQYAAPVMPGYVAQPVVPGKGVGIASMVLGIISLALFCFWFLALPCALVGCILGGVSINAAKQVNMKPSGMGIAGLVCSVVALGVAIVFTIIAIVGCMEAQSLAGSVANMSYYLY